MSINYKISPEIKAQIISRIKNDGVSVAQVAKDHGISDKTIYNWLGKSTESVSYYRELQVLKRENKALLELLGTMTLKMSESKKKS